MARRRFLVEQVLDNTAEIHGDDAHHLARVLRTEPGRQYEISDGTSVYLAEVSAVDKDRVVFRLIEPLDAPPVLVHVTLAAALIKFDRFEWLVEKATELGVAAIVPVHAARSEKGLMEASAKRTGRWRRIAHESSQQARRLRPPEIGEPQALVTALRTLSGHRYFLDETAGEPPLLSVLPPPAQRSTSDSITLAIGPEGGWTDAERTAATDCGWTPVSVGPLILRAETAAITAAGVLIHSWWASQLK